VADLVEEVLEVDAVQAWISRVGGFVFVVVFVGGV